MAKPCSSNGAGNECRESAITCVGEWVAGYLCRQYIEYTAGSYIEDKETALVWHYEHADPEFGQMQARELVKFLEKV